MNRNIFKFLLAIIYTHSYLLPSTPIARPVPNLLNMPTDVKVLILSKIKESKKFAQTISRLRRVHKSLNMFLMQNTKIQEDFAKAFLQENQIDALHTAIHLNWPEMVQLLIKNGEDINAQSQSKNKPWISFIEKPLHTPLIIATRKGYKEIVQLLLDMGADINAKNNHEHTALSWACSLSTKKDIAELLLNKGADIEAKDRWGSTSLHDAVGIGAIDTIELLLDRGANIKARDNTGKTPLHLRPLSNDEKVIRLLIEKGADINAKCPYGETPIYKASVRGQTRVVKTLLENGADENIRNNCGILPIDQATHRKFTKIIDLLKNANSIKKNARTKRKLKDIN